MSWKAALAERGRFFGGMALRVERHGRGASVRKGGLRMALGVSGALGKFKWRPPLAGRGRGS